MFETISRGFKAAKSKLTGVAELTPENIEDALRDFAPYQLRLHGIDARRTARPPVIIRQLPCAALPMRARAAVVTMQRRIGRAIALLIGWNIVNRVSRGAAAAPRRTR